MLESPSISNQYLIKFLSIFNQYPINIPWNPTKDPSTSYQLPIKIPLISHQYPMKSHEKPINILSTSYQYPINIPSMILLLMINPLFFLCRGASLPPAPWWRTPTCWRRTDSRPDMVLLFLFLVLIYIYIHINMRIYIYV